MGMELTAHRNVPKMEEAISVAHSLHRVGREENLIINLGILIFDQASPQW